MTCATRRSLPIRSLLRSGCGSWFFTGLVVFGPVAVTVYIAWWFIDTVDNWVKPLAPASLWPDTYLPFHVPGFGVVIALVGLTLLGFLAANIAGRTLVGSARRCSTARRCVRGIYKSVKQIFETVFSQSGTPVSQGRAGRVSAQGLLVDRVHLLRSRPRRSPTCCRPGEMTSVFLPCTPNPTTGFYFFVPTADVIELAMTPGGRGQTDHVGRAWCSRKVRPRSPRWRRRRDWRRRWKRGARAGGRVSRERWRSPPGGLHVGSNDGALNEHGAASRRARFRRRLCGGR